MWLLSHSRITNESKDCTNCYDLLFISLSIPVFHVLSEQRRCSCPMELTWLLQARHRAWWCCVLSNKGQPIKANTPNHKHPFTTLICFCWAHALPVLAFSKYCSSWVPMAKYLWKAHFISWKEVFARNCWCPFLMEMLDTPELRRNIHVLEGKVLWPQSSRVILQPSVKSTTFEGRCFVG